MKPPKCRLCGHEHWLRDPHVFASNAASNRNASNNGRENPVEGGPEKRSKPLPRPIEAMAEVVRGRAAPVQRGLQRDVIESGNVSAPEGSSDEKGVLEDNGVERGLDGGKRLKQRWMREAYNAYMRDYMRKRRSVSA